MRLLAEFSMIRVAAYASHMVSGYTIFIVVYLDTILVDIGRRLVMSNKRIKVTRENYPTWTCGKCAEEAGGRFPKDHIATYHYNICDVCGQKTTVTQPKDYGYPRYETRATKS
jgi:hypothetical protein